MRIPMRNPIVEMNGDEMARVIWGWVKRDLIEPFVDLRTVYFDLGIRVRDETEDRVTREAAEALKVHRVGVKCPTITPDKERMKEYGLRALWPSPNATLRSALRGTIFRSPLPISRIKPLVRTWSRPIVVARHGFGDVYSAVELELPGSSTVVLRASGSWGEVERELRVEGRGVVIAYHNLDEAIEAFARACFEYALERRMNLWFSAKDTIAKAYDGRFKEIFEKLYEERYRKRFEEAGLRYEYFLIDDAYARAIRSSGGFVWAVKNYDGDVISELVITAFSGSVAMATSEIMSPEGVYYSEAVHGTVRRHYYRYLSGEKPYTNPIGIILAWALALKRRGLVDGENELVAFAEELVESVRDVVDVLGYGTPDIAELAEPKLKVVGTTEFIRLVRERLGERLRTRFGAAAPT